MSKVILENKFKVVDKHESNAKLFKDLVIGDIITITFPLFGEIYRKGRYHYQGRLRVMDEKGNEVYKTQLELRNIFERIGLEKVE